MPTKEQTDRLNDVLKSLQKEFGDEQVMVPSLKTGSSVNWIETPSPSLNDLLGHGVPQGRMIEIYGPESSGKTSLACFIAATFQKAGLLVGYIDTENALDHEYAQTFGLDMKKVIIAQPDSGEKALDILRHMVENDVHIAIVDSTDAIVPQAELDGEMGDQFMAVRARLLSRACRVITSQLKHHPTVIIWICQTRAAIGLSPHADPVQSSASKAIRFYASIRIKITHADYVKGRIAGELIGQLSRVKTVKNKVASPGRVRLLTVHYGQGYQTEHEWLEFAIAHGIIQKSGTGWFVLPNGKKVQGQHNIIAAVNEQIEGGWPLMVEQTKEKMRHSEDAPVILESHDDGPGEKETVDEV